MPFSEAGILSGYHYFRLIAATSKSCSDLNSEIIIRAYGIVEHLLLKHFAIPTVSNKGKSKYDRKDIHNAWFSLVINPFNYFKVECFKFRKSPKSNKCFNVKRCI